MQMNTIMMMPAVVGILTPVKVTAVRMPVAICMAAMMLPHTTNRGLRPCLQIQLALCETMQETWTQAHPQGQCRLACKFSVLLSHD